MCLRLFFFFQAEDGIRDLTVTGVQTCALPISALHVPVRDRNGRLLVDGGLVANLPISYTRELGADIVIAVDVGADGAKFMDRPKTALGVLTQTFVAVERIVSNQERDNADVLIAPRVGRRRSEEHTSELQSQSNLVCRLLLA